jgi:hypothetical protein
MEMNGGKFKFRLLYLPIPLDIYTSLSDRCIILLVCHAVGGGVNNISDIWSFSTSTLMMPAKEVPEKLVFISTLT